MVYVTDKRWHIWDVTMLLNTNLCLWSPLTGVKPSNKFIIQHIEAHICPWVRKSLWRITMAAILKLVFEGAFSNKVVVFLLKLIAYWTFSDISPLDHVMVWCWTVDESLTDGWVLMVAWHQTGHALSSPYNNPPHCEKINFLFTDPCPLFYTFLGGRCYRYVYNQRLPWVPALQFCQKDGTDLASMDSLAEWATVLLWLNKGWYIDKLDWKINSVFITGTTIGSMTMLASIIFSLYSFLSLCELDVYITEGRQKEIWA